VSRTSTLIDLAAIAVSTLSTALAAIIDCRTLRIPNRLTFSLISLGIIFLAFRCAFGYSAIWAGHVVVISYVFVYGLWKFRLWGGGDAKLVLALLILLSPAYPPFAFMAVFSISLALLLLLKHAIFRQRYAKPAAIRPGPMSAEDIASLRESGAGPMGPSLLAALVIAVALLEALP
jgi:Flp pilus assembly protein protease CpaA